MAEDFLKSIYEEALLIYKLRKVAEYAKVYDAHHAVMLINEISPKITELCKDYAERDVFKARQLWSEILKLSHYGSDIVFLGDFAEMLIPLLQEKVRLWGDIETENVEGDYRFETSLSGFLTIKDIKNGFYLHSKIDPMWEAKKRAETIFEPQKDSYSILGCGLGYLAYQLYEITDGSVVINVFEKDARMVEYAKNYGVLDWIPEDRLNVVIDSDILTFLHSAEDENVGFYIFPQELATQTEDVRSILMDICIEYNTIKRFSRERSINFWRNARCGTKFIAEFEASGLSKDFIVVAAGPSLDNSIDFLRKNKGKKTLVAVGTVFRKLIDKDIFPDMVVVLDPQARTYKQIEGLEEQQVPLLIGMSGYWKFATAYKGDKYLIPTTDMHEIIDFANKREMKLWSCGGTVTALAMEVANRFGAENIYLVGVDLAYPNGITHATGTMDRTTKDTKSLIKTEGVGNTTVYSDRVFMKYREDMELMIESNPHITYYNMSKIGAKIAGTIDGDDIVEEKL